MILNVSKILMFLFITVFICFVSDVSGKSINGQEERNETKFGSYGNFQDDMDEENETVANAANDCDTDSCTKKICNCCPGYSVNPGGIFLKDTCKKCDCGKTFNCTFSGSFQQKRCLCGMGYSEFNGKCKSDCKTNPCKNGGKCVKNNNDVLCQCKENYTGEFCEKIQEESLCSLNKPHCEETGGICIMEKNGEIHCLCPDETEYSYGIGCQSICAVVNCQNGGICKIIENEPVCECPEEYKGYSCEAHKCDGKKCHNNGTCKVQLGQAECECPDDFEGENCEIFGTGVCSSLKKNCTETGGICKLDSNAEIQCKCPRLAKYDVDHGCQVSNYICKKFMPYCIETGGSCIPDEHDEFICRCPEGTEYQHGCQVYDPCASNPCQNKGMCITQGNGYRCLCKEPYTGLLCENVQQDNCSMHQKNCQETGGTCISFNENIQCKCPINTRYHYDKGCIVEQDNCSMHQKNCQETGGICISFNENIQCKCPMNTRYHYDKGCIDDCITNVCKNNGICKTVNGEPKCFCMEPYTGKFCENRTDLQRTAVIGAGLLVLLILFFTSVTCLIVCRICLRRKK